MRYLPIACLAAIALAAPAVAVAADEPQPAAPLADAVAADAANWQRVDVYPPTIHLSGTADYQHAIAIATRADGQTADVTAQASWSIADPALVSFADGVCRPAADGKTRLTASWNGHEAAADVEVIEATATAKVSFTNDVVPILTKSGCNTGSCHGAARGKDGFRISLFGFDPAGDYFRITREIGVRRVNLAIPEHSLVLQKATGAVPHTGGKRIEPGSPHYETLRRWIDDDAPMDGEGLPAVAKVDLYPPQLVLVGPGQKTRMVAVATYADGRTRDLTEWATFSSNNDRSAAVDAEGVLTSGAPGESFVMARFDVHTVGSQVLSVAEGSSAGEATQHENYIDQLVAAKLQKLRIAPSEICTDAEFLRRVYIDIVGQLPPGEKVEAFLADSSPSKREAVVDELLARKEFSEIWAAKWASILKIKSDNTVSAKATFLYSQWLTNKIADNEPIDAIARELLTASGGVFDQPATNFYQTELDRLKLSENVAQVFMGIRTQCAQCHNHPFDRWTMDDYYGFVAFFSQIGRKDSEDYRQRVIFSNGGGEVNHPVTNARVAPKFLGGPTPEIKPGEDRREVLARWLTSEENPYFAESIANRIWEHFTGVGVVSPVDDFRVSNPASNPELLQELACKLREYDFDFKRLVRDICTSQTYQRSTIATDANADDLRNYSHALPRRIPAESLLDCISAAIGKPEKFRGLPLGARAVQIADGSTSNYFLTTFGRSPRTTVCACEASTDPSLSQALHLINGNTISNKLQESSALKGWIDAGLSDEQTIEQIYLRSLARKPTEAETTGLIATIAAAGDRRKGLEDAFWAVLNSREFLFNH